MLRRTIAEESPAVVQRSTRTKRTTKITSENNSDDVLTRDTAALIANSLAVVPQAAAASEQVSSITKTTTIITKKVVSDGVNRASPVVELRSSNKTTRSSNRETDQNTTNDLIEKSAKLRTSTPQKLNDSNNSSFNDINLEEHPAYKEYKEAGEYWK